jgi:flagellar biosynthesis protein FliP
MDLLSKAADAADSASSGAKVVASVAGTAYGLTSLPYTQIATGLTICLTLFYLVMAMPRMWRTIVALKRGVFNKDWSVWQKLGDQPAPNKDD